MIVKTTAKALEFFPNDSQYFEEVLTGVVEMEEDFIEITSDLGTLRINKLPTFTPTVGMKVKYYGKGIGHPIRGVVINDIIFFYRSEEEAKEDHKKYCDELDKKYVEEFEQNKSVMDADYNALPEVFQKRIDRFRSHNKEFRWRYEQYEMFCCKEAIKIATTLKTFEAIKAWKESPQGEQIKLVDLDHGHSGNSFGCATVLAMLYVSKPDMVVDMHGALTPLVGCKDYGCYHDNAAANL
jgi:hypothetical protein